MNKKSTIQPGTEVLVITTHFSASRPIRVVEIPAVVTRVNSKSIWTIPIANIGSTKYPELKFPKQSLKINSYDLARHKLELNPDIYKQKKALNDTRQGLIKIVQINAETATLEQLQKAQRILNA